MADERKLLVRLRVYQSPAADKVQSLQVESKVHLDLLDDEAAMAGVLYSILSTLMDRFSEEQKKNIAQIYTSSLQELMKTTSN